MPTLSAIESQLFLLREHLQTCGRRDFASALNETIIARQRIPWYTRDHCKFFSYTSTRNVNSFSDRYLSIFTGPSKYWSNTRSKSHRSFMDKLYFGSHIKTLLETRCGLHGITKFIVFFFFLMLHALHEIKYQNINTRNDWNSFYGLEHTSKCYTKLHVVILSEVNMYGVQTVPILRLVPFAA
jgi:hypothetical protein